MMKVMDYDIRVLSYLSHGVGGEDLYFKDGLNSSTIMRYEWRYVTHGPGYAVTRKLSFIARRI